MSFPPPLRSFLLAPFRLQTYGNLCYLALAFPLGVAYFVVLITGFSLALALSLLLIGVPILLGTLLLARGLAAGERVVARTLLGVDLPTAAYAFLGGSARERVSGLALDRRTWLECGFLLAKFPVGIGALVVLSTTLTLSVALLATPFYYDQPGVRIGFFPADPIAISPTVTVPWGDLLVGFGVATTLTEWVADSLADALVLSALGLVTLLVTLNLVNGAAWLLARFAGLVLGDATANGAVLGRLADRVR